MSDTEQTFQIDRIELATEIVAAYVANNPIPVAELPGLIANVHAAITALGKPEAAAEEPAAERATPSQIRKSITPDALISFIDGKPYKTLKRHLTRHGLDAAGYRAKFGLPGDYPMVATNYSEQRSSLAKELGLGQQRRGRGAKAAAAEVSAEAESADGSEKKRRGRKKADTPLAAE